MGLSWISCGDVAATLMTSPGVWKNNYCARPPWGKERAFLQSNAFLPPLILHEPVWWEMLSRRVLISVAGCHSCFGSSDRSNIFPQATKIFSSTHASGYCKADELLKWLIMISGALSIMSREQDFNLTANITLQQLQPIKSIFHTSFVIWWLLLREALEIRHKVFSCSLSSSDVVICQELKCLFLFLPFCVSEWQFPFHMLNPTCKKM